MPGLGCDIAVVGGGVLGVTTAYWLSEFYECFVLLLEKEIDAALHSTLRNTGIVHRPYYLNPWKKRLSAPLAVERIRSAGRGREGEGRPSGRSYGCGALFGHKRHDGLHGSRTAGDEDGVERVTAGKRSDLMSDLVPELLKRKARVAEYYTTGLWYDVGTITSYERLNSELRDYAVIHQGSIGIAPMITWAWPLSPTLKIGSQRRGKPI